MLSHGVFLSRGGYLPIQLLLELLDLAFELSCSFELPLSHFNAHSIHKRLFVSDQFFPERLILEPQLVQSPLVTTFTWLLGLVDLVGRLTGLLMLDDPIDWR